MIGFDRTAPSKGRAQGVEPAKPDRSRAPKNAFAQALMALKALAKSHPVDGVLARIREQIEHGDQGQNAA
jgi:hypothetical protein